MRIVYIKCKDNSQYEIPESLVSKFSYSGSINQGARVLNITFAKTDFKFNAGDTIGVYDDNLEFVGQLLEIEKSNNEIAQSITFTDYLIHLENSKDTMVVNSTPEGVTLMICNKLGIATGNIWSTGIATGSIAFKAKTYFDIITECYKKAQEKSGYGYICRMNGAKLDVVPRTEIIDVVFEEGKNIENIVYKESIQDMVNKVVVYNDKNVKVNEKTTEYINTMGTFQEIANEKDNISEILTDPKYELKITAIGDNRCISGKICYFRDTETNLYGLYEITADSHTFENGLHKMDLTLEFRRLV